MGDTMAHRQPRQSHSVILGPIIARMDEIHRQVMQSPDLELQMAMFNQYMKGWIRSAHGGKPDMMFDDRMILSLPRPVQDMARAHNEALQTIQQLPEEVREGAMGQLEQQYDRMLREIAPSLQERSPSLLPLLQTFGKYSPLGPLVFALDQSPTPVRVQAPARVYSYRVAIGSGPQQQIYTLALPKPIEDYYQDGIRRGNEAAARGERLGGRSGTIPPSEAGASTREAMLDSVLMHSLLNPAPPDTGHLPGISVRMEGPPTAQALTFNGPHGSPEETRNFQIDHFHDQYLGRLDANGVYVARNDVSVADITAPRQRRPRRRG